MLFWAQTPTDQDPHVTPSQTTSALRGIDHFDKHDSMDELAKAEHRLADLAAEDLPTVIHLWVSVRDLDTRQPRTAPLLMKLRKQISLAEFWIALKAQNVKSMREANLTAAFPRSISFKCTPEAKSADGSDPKKFRRHCLASRSHEADCTFRELLNICLREGKPRAEKLLDEVNKKAKRVRVLRTKVPRYNTAASRETPRKWRCEQKSVSGRP